MGTARIPKIHPDLYSVQRINILKYQKDWLTRSQVIMNKNTVLTDGK